MGNKEKRKLQSTDQVQVKDKLNENDPQQELLNTIDNEEAEDSSDSEREIEDSEDEADKYLEEESEGSGEDLSEEESDSEEDLEESEENDIDSEESEKITSEEESENEGKQTSNIEQKSSSSNEDGESRSNVRKKSNRDVEKTESSVINQVSDYDTSDEEDIRNTVGNVPKNWYNEFKHMGYDWDGNKIIKPETGDHLDNFLKKMEDPDFWRTVKDPQTGQEVILSEEDIQLIKRVRAQKIPDSAFDDYAPWIEWFTSEVMKMPIRRFPEHKRSFLPSKHEAQKVSKLVHALKMGWIKTREEQAKLRAKKEPQFYMMWQTDDQAEHMRRINKHIPAPKRLLPGHAESYNPPPEYLFDSRELKQWNRLKSTPWKRKLHFIPEKYDSLRKVPAYPRFIKERFLRCLDLYLAPRAIKMKVQVDPQDLVPKLPSPRDLQPFPTTLSIEYKGHTDMVRSLSTDKTGQFLLSGSNDGTVRIWEVNTGRCLKTIITDETVRSVEWCPNAALSLVLIASGKQVLLINPGVGDHLVYTKTDSVLAESPTSDVVLSERVRQTVQWSQPEDEMYKKGIRVVLTHFKEVTQVTWHGRGDYFASVMPEGQNRSVLISQVSQRRSQLPLSKSKGLVQCVVFHPTKPCIFVATQRHVRIYDLMRQQLVKKLETNAKWISSMAVHPMGDNLLVGTYDRKMLWFDLDLSTKPYQTLRLHGTAVRGVAYHRRYPLFASGSDDCSVIVSHGMVYNDLLKNPLIVPLKRLQYHEEHNDYGIFAVHFHPLQPWVFSAGADSTIKLYSN